MKSEPTFTATIWVGVKEHYAPTPPADWHERACAVLQEYVDAVGLCVTFTPTEFLYTKGNEPGFCVGLINYPRFPSSPEVVKSHAIELARRLLLEFKQFKVSVVFPDETIMVEESDYV